MAIDLTGGIDPAREQVFAEKPDDPEMRDSVSFWVVDDRGAVGLPRIGIEAVAANWAAHDVQVNVAFPDGRVFRLRANGASWPVEGADGRPTILGAGGLGFRCIRPFDTWTMTFVGEAVQTSSQDLIEGKKDGSLVDVSFQVEAAMAVPPWVQGTLSAESGERLQTSIEGKLMGGARYEQLFRATGTVNVGDDEQTFTGTGLRIGDKACGNWPAFGAMPGSRRCSPAGAPSATSPIRRDPTGSQPSTRATSSTATETWSPRVSSRRRG